VDERAGAPGCSLAVGRCEVVVKRSQAGEEVVYYERGELSVLPGHSRIVHFLDSAIWEANCKLFWPRRTRKVKQKRLKEK
jgi:hypothetical protein